MITEKLLDTLVKAADDKRAEDIVVLNMKGLSLIADYFIICHANSGKQVQAISREMKDRSEEIGTDVKKIEGFDEGKWILMDFGDVIAHIFHRDERSYYNLEKLWGDAPMIDVISRVNR